MTPKQISMDLMPAPSYDRQDYILGGSNAMAADLIDRWPDWPGRIKGVVVYGPQDCGKSHLGAIWQATSKAQFMSSLTDRSLQDLDQNPHVIWDHPMPDDHWPEDLMFHMLNHLTEIQGSLLILSRQPMSSMNWQIADVISRLNGLSSAAISDPDDEMLSGLLYKHADDMGLALDHEVTRYILSRMERKFSAARSIMSAINNEALSTKKNVTVHLVKNVMEEQIKGS